MKKLLALILILALAVPAAAGSSEDYVGCWGVFFDLFLPDAQATTLMIVLNADGSMASFSVLGAKKDDGSLDIRATRGTWKAQGNMVVIANDENNISILEYKDDCLWYDLDDLKLGLKKLPDMERSQVVRNKKEGSNP